MVGRRHTVSHPRHRTRGVAANPDHRNHRHCFLPIQNPFQQQQQQQQQHHQHSNPGSPSSTSAMMTCSTAMTDSTLTMIEPRPGGSSSNNNNGADVTGQTQTSLLVATASTTARNNSLRLKPCLSSGSGPGGPRAVGLETVTMRTPPWKGSIQVLLKKDSVRSRNSYICEL